MNIPIQASAGRPLPDEYITYYGQYIDLVPEGDICELLAQQQQTTRALLSPLAPQQASYRPETNDWSIVEVVGHLADAERVFAYRALRFARGDATPLPGFDPDLFVSNTNFARRPLSDLLDELSAVRQATIALFSTFDPPVWLRRGVASDNAISVRALAYIVAGHELHHVEDFRRRYLQT